MNGCSDMLNSPLDKQRIINLEDIKAQDLEVKEILRAEKQKDN
ncbi:MAG: hypothetical protein ACOC1P_04365 [Minisyncoccales bacterium]